MSRSNSDIAMWILKVAAKKLKNLYHGFLNGTASVTVEEGYAVLKCETKNGEYIRKWRLPTEQEVKSALLDDPAE